MKTKLSLVVIVSLMLSINGCSNDVIENGKLDIQKNEYAEYDAALSNVLAFNGEPETKSDGNIMIKSSSTQSFSFKLGETTRSSANNIPDSASINIYTFILEKDGKPGFAIASGDERISKVYAYTENGQLSDTTYNEGLAYTLSQYPYIYEQELNNYYANDDAVTRAYLTYISIGPNVVTKWGQGYPYNNRCPAVSNCAHALVGCGGVAVAQALAYLKPAKTMSGVDYKILNSSAYPSNEDMAALFCFNVAYGIGTTFGCSASSSNTKNSESYLKGFNINTELHDGNIKINHTINSIALNGITLARGTQKSGQKAGHIWIYDGVRGSVYYNSGNPSYPYEKSSNWPTFHCNWGWNGLSDGWYTAAEGWEQPKNPTTDAFLADNMQIYIWGVAR